MIDTSVTVAGPITNHELHALARPDVAAAARGQAPGGVPAETWAVLAAQLAGLGSTLLLPTR